MVKADVQCISQNDFLIPQYINISSVISCFDYRSFARSKYLPLGARMVGPSCPMVLSLLFVYIYFFSLAIHIGRKRIRHSEQTQRHFNEETFYRPVHFINYTRLSRKHCINMLLLA